MDMVTFQLSGVKYSGSWLMVKEAGLGFLNQQQTTNQSIVQILNIISIIDLKTRQ